MSRVRRTEQGRLHARWRGLAVRDPADEGRLARYWMAVPQMAIPHIDEDGLELYALGRLAEAHAAPVEEHLLVCEECRQRLAEWDTYVAAMRAAMQWAALNRR